MFSKYFVSSSPVYLDIEDDAAVAQWGNGWRMPSEAEILELIDKTTRSLAYMHGVRGIRLTGPSGKSIFMPTASEMSKDEISTYGFIGLDSFVFWRHFNAGSYWSNCLYPESMESKHSYCLSLSVELLDQTEKGAKMEFNTRVTGLPIRAVHDK